MVHTSLKTIVSFQRGGGGGGGWYSNIILPYISRFGRLLEVQNFAFHFFLGGGGGGWGGSEK